MVTILRKIIHLIAPKLDLNLLRIINEPFLLIFCKRFLKTPSVDDLKMFTFPRVFFFEFTTKKSVQIEPFNTELLKTLIPVSIGFP